MNITRFFLCVLIFTTLFSCKENIVDNGATEILKECNIEVLSNGNGTVSSSGKRVLSGETITITAKPRKGYVFKYWLVNKTIVSIENNTTIEVYEDTKFVAYFQKEESLNRSIDLGLSVDWADFNLGASSAEEYGDFFAWGDVEQKSSIDYYWGTYTWCSGSHNTLFKYNTDKTYGHIDNKRILESGDDACRKMLGNGWKIPSKKEFEELRNRCSWRYESLNGVDGYRVTGKNGNSIFLPIAGVFKDSQHLNIDKGYYWANEIGEISPSDAYILKLSEKDREISTNARKDGVLIRAVFVK